MPRIARGQAAAVCTHVINRGNGREQVFHDEADYAAFIELLGSACERVPMRVIACCLMPNHFHRVLWPRAEGELSQWMHWLMTSHVRRHHRRYGTSGHVWGGRFKSFVIQRRGPSAAERARGALEVGDPVLRVVRYVERNPLRAGLVTSADRWAWSSLQWWSRPSEAPQFWSRKVVKRLRNWLDLVNRPEANAELGDLRRCVRRGRPFGSEKWARRIAAELGLESTMRPRGRPRKKAK